MSDETSEILDATGRPVKLRPLPPVVANCPRCGKGPDRRRLSAGFGEPHDVCGSCGYDFPERTL